MSDDHIDRVDGPMRVGGGGAYVKSLVPMGVLAYDRGWIVPPGAGDQARDTIARIVQERDAAEAALIEMRAAVDVYRAREAERCSTWSVERFMAMVLDIADGEDRMPEETIIDRVIRDLTARRVSPPDVKRLGDAVDAAKAPLGGRAGADEALGRAVRVTK